MSNTKESIVLKYDDMGIPSIMLKVENTAKTPETYINLTEVPQILKDLGIITDDMKENSEWLSADADLEEAIPFVGGCYDDTSNAGPSALSLGNERSDVWTNRGFFSACLGEPVRR